MHRFIIGLAFLVLLALSTVAVRADRLAATWIGPGGNGGEGNWNTSSNWNLGIVPNNGTDGNGDGVPDIYDVQIDDVPTTASLVHGDTRIFALAGLTVDSGDTLELYSPSGIRMNDSDGASEIVNNGLIRIDAPPLTNPRLSFSGETLSLSGNGTIELGIGILQPGTIAPLDGGRIVNGPDHTITTTGQGRISRIGTFLSPAFDFRAALTNRGTIRAADEGVIEAELREANHLNDGTVEATTGGKVFIYGMNTGIFHNRGLIFATDDGSLIESSEINVSNESGGVMRASQLGGIILTATTSAPITNAGLIEAVDGGGIGLRGMNIANVGQGQIQARSGGVISLSNGEFRPDPAIQVADSQSRLEIIGNAIFENDGNVLTAGPGVLGLGRALIRGGEVTSGVGALEIGLFQFGRPTLENVRLTGTAHGSGFDVGGSLTVDSVFTATESMSLGTEGQAYIRGAGVSRFLGGADIRSTGGALVIAREHVAVFHSLDIHNGELCIDGTIISEAGTTAFGTLSGSGTIVSPFLHITDGTISPGVGIGTLRIIGNLEFFGSEALYMAELAESASDQLQIVGNLRLDTPSDNLALDGGLSGHSYVIAQYTGEREGTFDNVTPGYNVIYDDVAKQIRVEPIPEPPGWALFVVAAMLFAATNRRQSVRAAI
jgi:hypothetical protein